MNHVGTAAGRINARFEIGKKFQNFSTNQYVERILKFLTNHKSLMYSAHCCSNMFLGANG
jgi:hypothetical protein